MFSSMKIFMSFRQSPTDLRQSRSKQFYAVVLNEDVRIARMSNMKNCSIDALKYLENRQCWQYWPPSRLWNIIGKLGVSWSCRYCNARPTLDEAGASSSTSSPCNIKDIHFPRIIYINRYFTLILVNTQYSQLRNTVESQGRISNKIWQKQIQIMTLPAQHSAIKFSIKSVDFQFSQGRPKFLFSQ